MENKKVIEALNTLVIINNDRIEGYKTAEAEAKDTDLKMLFSDFMQTSVDCHRELVAEVKHLGGTPEEGTKITGKFFRVWMEVKAAFNSNDRNSILESCNYGEDVASEAYKKVLIHNFQDTTSNEQDMLNKHHALLKADQAKIKHLLEVIATQKSNN